MEPIRGKKEIIDPYYRYNMETLKFQKEKTKTCILNLESISNSLKIPNMNLILTYFKKRLSIAITNKKGRIIISSDVDNKQIKNALYEFIEYFVLCDICNLPELEYKSESKGTLVAPCKSCGSVKIFEANEITEKVIKAFIESINSKKKRKDKK